jgi:dihydropyrimidine dehydrogenase (NAD+) subunit PreT
MASTPEIAPGRLDDRQLARNFSDLREPLAPNEARIEAERCLFCFDAPCVTACPTGIDVPLFIRQIAGGNADGAARTILDENILGGMCARVCPTETLCESACVRAAEDRPIEIGLLQRHATDHLFAGGRQLYAPGPPSGRRVAVVGAGPAGLSCAHRLAVLGHEVTIFEARPKAGGLNEYGIAAYKTPGGFAQEEVDYVLGVGGIDVEHGRRLGEDLTLDELQAGFDAVFLGVGLGGVNALGIVDDAPEVGNAVDFIADLRQADDLAKLPIGRRVVVVGGGMTAIDMASQARRLGAEEVTIVYRRGAAEMGASGYEQQLAQTDGVLIRHWLRPHALRTEGGRLVGVELERTAPAPDGIAGTGDIVEIACDQLFRAIGQRLLPDEAGPGALELVNGRVRVDATGATSRPGVWAGGDCVAGGEDLTVQAVEDGKRAAHAIDGYLRGEDG